MPLYTIIVIFINFSVNFLLMIASSIISGRSPMYKQAVLSSAFNCVCLIASMRWQWLGNGYFRATSILFSAFIAFGFCGASIRPCAVAMLLHFAVSGIAAVTGGNRVLNALLATVCVCGVCYIGFSGSGQSDIYIPVEIIYRGIHLKIHALRDTGNLLTDPLTGRSVMVLSCDCAHSLTGLSKQQMQNPIETLAERPMTGLRIIPYSTIGNPNGMLLAVYVKNVRVGKWRGGRLIALAPDDFDGNGRYQAITGGSLC